jgi:outer membrane biosynthesis protein TonB
VVTLPSFGAPPSPGATGRSNVARPGSNAVTVVASPRAGGAMNLYGAMKGDRVYSIYVGTSIGQASMQFADPASAARPYADELTAPTPIRTDLPIDLPHQKLVVRYVLDRNGNLQSPQVLNAESSDFESKLLAALANWKFTPALRGREAIEVNVILGFGIDTN